MKPVTLLAGFALALAAAPAQADPQTLTVDTPFSAIAEGSYPLVPVPDSGSVLPVATLPGGFSFHGADADHVRSLLATQSGSASFIIDPPAAGFFGNLLPTPSGARGNGRDFRLFCTKSGGQKGAILEELAIDGAGNATLLIHQVWVDTKSCAFAYTGVQTIALKPLALLEGAPLAYALRKGEELTVFLPPSTGIAVSAENDRLGVQRGGALDRVTVPIHRGMATAIAAQVTGLRDWSAAAHGQPTPTRTTTATAIGVDITQTSSAPAPLIVVHAKTAP